MNDFDPEEMHRASPDDLLLAAKSGTEFSGKLLQPWSAARKIAAQCMGLLYPHIGDDGYEQLERTGIYAGAFKDVIIFIWICSQENKSDIMRAQRKPAEAWENAQKWAEREGLADMSSAKFAEAYVVFSNKMTAELSAQSRPEIPTESEGNAGPKI